MIREMLNGMRTGAIKITHTGLREVRETGNRHRPTFPLLQLSTLGRGIKGDLEKVAKKTKKKNRRDKKTKTTTDLMELMDDNFTIDLATIPGMASQEEDDREKLRNWERGVKAGVGITFGQMMKKQPLAKAVPYQLRGLYREWLILTQGLDPKDIPVGQSGKNPKASQCVKVGLTFPLPGGKEWIAMLERHESGTRSAKSAEKHQDDRIMEECMHAAFVENYNLCKAFYIRNWRLINSSTSTRSQNARRLGVTKQ